MSHLNDIIRRNIKAIAFGAAIPTAFATLPALAQELTPPSTKSFQDTPKYGKTPEIILDLIKDMIIKDGLRVTRIEFPTIEIVTPEKIEYLEKRIPEESEGIYYLWGVSVNKDGQQSYVVKRRE